MANYRLLNQAIIDRLATPDGINKFAELEGKIIRDQVREDSFANKLLPPEDVSPNDPGVQVSIHHDTLVKIVELEPESRACRITFRGEPKAVLIQGDRVEVAFSTISSLKYEKFEEELMAYAMPITQWIENNIPKDVEAVIDLAFTEYIELAVQSEQDSVNAAGAYNRTTINAGTQVPVRIVKGEQALVGASGTDDFQVRPLQKPDLVSLFNLIDGDYKELKQVLIGATDYNDALRWILEDVGDTLLSETTVSGWTKNDFMGRKVFRTLKTDILRPGNIYGFTDPEWIGVNYVLTKLKFYVEKKVNRISWQARMNMGMAIINVSSIAKLELYRGSVRPGYEDTGYAARLPLSEDQLNRRRHRVPEGDVFPRISMY